MKRTKEMILYFLRGLIMGTADIIPGVSGGTIALITGIYEKLIFSINQVFELILNIAQKRYDKIMDNLKKIDFLFVLPLIFGIGLAFIAFSAIIEYLLDTYTAITFALFFGLILGSSIFVFKKIGKFNLNILLASAAGLVFAFLLVGFNISREVSHSYGIIFLSGAIAISAMILPGISGAFILLMLNQYHYMLNVIHNFELSKIIIFMIGASVGLLLFSKLLNYLLTKKRGLTLGFLTGLMLGSLRLPVVNIKNSMTGSIIPLIITALIGFIIVIILEIVFIKNPPSIDQWHEAKASSSLEKTKGS